MNRLIRSGVVCITPTIAKELLDDHNNHNRNISNATVDRYARDMLNNRWYSNGVPIIIGEQSGEVKDGQHRLAAIAKSGIWQEIEIKYIRDEDAKGYDENRMRSTADILKFNNVVDRSLAIPRIVAIAKFALILDKNGVPMRAVKPTTSETEAWIDNNKPLITAYLDMLPRGNLFTAPESVAIMSAMKCGVEKSLIQAYIDFMNCGHSEVLNGQGWYNVRDRKNKKSYPWADNSGIDRIKSYYATQFLLYKACRGKIYNKFTDSHIGKIYFNFNENTL